jgi:dihydroxy-acid dehydratase
MTDQPPKRLRSDIWFNDMTAPGAPAVYLDASTITASRARAASRPADHRHAQSGGDLTPCNQFISHLPKVKDGIRDAGGVPFEFPMHPLQESCRRPGCLDRNLAYLGLVEILCRYPLTAWCSRRVATRLRRQPDDRHHEPSRHRAFGGPMLDAYQLKAGGIGHGALGGRRQVAAGKMNEHS